MTSAESLTLKVGDLVRVLPREMHSKEEAYAFTGEMDAYIGMVCAVTYVMRLEDRKVVLLRTEDGALRPLYGLEWYFFPSFIERVTEDDVCSPDVCMLKSLFLAAE